MAAPEPMLSTSATTWPAGGDWILQPKWDGFRVLVEVPARGPVRAWSRHGVSLTLGLAEILEALAQLPAGTVIDGELVAIAQPNGRPVQDFAAVQRAVLQGDAEAADRLHFVAFDLLRIAGTDVRSRTWRERDELLRSGLPTGRVVRVIESQPAAEATHEAIVALGFEGTVLKRPRSTYRAGRQSAWRKYKARHAADGILVGVHVDRDGRRWAICEVGDQRVPASASTDIANAARQPVKIVYSRTDADGSLREARLANTSHPAETATLGPANLKIELDPR